MNRKAIACGFRFSLASLLAFIFYNFFDLAFGYWAVVTVAAVMQPYLKMTSRKAILRLAGTLMGVVLAFFAVLLIKAVPDSLFIVFFLAMFVCGWLMFFNARYSYLGIVCGITTIIIITTYNQSPALFFNVEVDRTIDVIIGILISWLCSVLLFPDSVRMTQDSSIKQQSKSKKVLFDQSFIVGISCTIALAPWFGLHYAGGFWGPISCLFIIDENIDKTQKKSFQRFMAHVIVVSIALLLSFILSSKWIVALALVSGMFYFGVWMIKPPFKFEASMANTMAIAYSIVLLASPGQLNTIHTGLARFLNTLVGIAVGMLVVNLIHRTSNGGKLKTQ